MEQATAKSLLPEARRRAARLGSTGPPSPGAPQPPPAPRPTTGPGPRGPGQRPTEQPRPRREHAKEEWGNHATEPCGLVNRASKQANITHLTPRPCPVLGGARATTTPRKIRVATAAAYVDRSTDRAQAPGRGRAPHLSGALTRPPHPPAQKNPSMQRRLDAGGAATRLRGTHPSHTAL